MRLLLLASLLVSLPAIPLTARADDAKPAADSQAMHAGDCARARAQHKTCVLDMGGDEIEANAPTAGGSAVGILEFAKGRSLIRIRRDFIVEILRSAEDI